MNAHRRFLGRLRDRLEAIDEALQDLRADVDQRIERIDQGENSAGVLVGLTTPLQDFVSTVRGLEEVETDG